MFSFNFLLKCHRCQVILGWEKIEGFGKHGLYIKKKKKPVQVRGLFPVAVLPLRQTAHPKPLWTSKGKSKIFLTKDFLWFRIFCLNLILRTIWIFLQDFLRLLSGMIPMRPVHCWFRAEPFLVGTRQIAMKWSFSSLPSQTVLWFHEPISPWSHLKATIWTLWFHHDEDPRVFPRQWLFLLSCLHFKSRKESTAKQSWSCQIKHQGQTQERMNFLQALSICVCSQLPMPLLVWHKPWDLSGDGSPGAPTASAGPPAQSLISSCHPRQELTPRGGKVGADPSSEEVNSSASPSGARGGGKGEVGFGKIHTSWENTSGRMEETLGSSPWGAGEGNCSFIFRGEGWSKK